jgi:hypothetical protein
MTIERSTVAGSSWRTTRWVVIAAMLVLELALLAALALGLPALLAAFFHLGIVVAGTVLLARIDGDFANALVIGLGTLSLGPVGALAAVAATLRAEQAARDPELAQWHDRIMDRQPASPVEMLYRDIIEGRAYRPAAVPASFADVMASSDIGRRQRLLGLLAKSEIGAPKNLIDAGLAATELAVRAPAAAVVTRLREIERERAR